MLNLPNTQMQFLNQHNVCACESTPISVVNVVADSIPVTLKSLSFGIVNDGLNTMPSNLTNSLMFLNP